MRRVVKLHDENLIVGSARRYKSWSDEDLEKLRELYNKDYSVNLIAKMLGRTYSTVKNKITVLGLREYYYLDAVFPQDKSEWKYFMRKIEKSDNCFRLLKNLGEEYTVTIFLKAIEVAVIENIINKKEFEDIIIKFKLRETRAYEFYKKNNLIGLNDII